jgi:hypothetical protein
MDIVCSFLKPPSSTFAQNNPTQGITWSPSKAAADWSRIPISFIILLLILVCSELMNTVLVLSITLTRNDFVAFINLDLPLFIVKEV